MKVIWLRSDGAWAEIDFWSDPSGELSAREVAAALKAAGRETRLVTTLEKELEI